MKTLYKGIMEGELNELPAFSSPEASKQVDIDLVKSVENDLRKMSKILGKASQQCIKLMMDGVKHNWYNTMDLSRGIQTGPVKATHYGERDFIKQLWHKVKSGFKRYS